MAGPAVSVVTVANVAEANLPDRDYGLSVDQGLAVEKIATSGRVLDVLVGPAGTGKSTTMASLRAAWEAEHGSRSVIGLAPSAAAAEVLGIRARHRHREHRQVAHRVAAHPRAHGPAGPSRRQRGPSALTRTLLAARRLRSRLQVAQQAIAERRLYPGQLVIVDEASLAGTFALDELVAAARDAGAKVLLAGDWAQLSGVAAGGAFALLVRDRGDLVPELTDVRRFRSDWEKAASVELRLGNKTAINAYEARGRITDGDQESLLAAIYEAWKSDVSAGKSSLMIAGDSATVVELNRRARADRIRVGTVADDGLRVARRPDGRGRRRGGHSSEQPAARNREELGEERRPLGGHRHQPRWKHGVAPWDRWRRGRAPRRLRRPARRARVRNDGVPITGPLGGHHPFDGHPEYHAGGVVRLRVKGS
jgi:hypothetical protein